MTAGTEIFERPAIPVLTSRAGRLWRIVSTGFCFAVFGLGGIGLGFIIFPLIHLTSFGKARAQKRCRWLVGRGFRLFRWMSETVGAINVTVDRPERLKGLKGTVVIANHPSLLDVVLIVGEMDDSYCVVKRAAWSNPFLMGIMQATGYIANVDGPDLVAKCADTLKAGGNIMLFPEGTRTRPGGEMDFKRGFAITALMSDCDMLPVYVFVSPPSLRKHEQFYQVPWSQSHFELFVGTPHKPADFGVTGEQTPVNARLLTDRVLTHFEQKLDQLRGY